MSVERRTITVASHWGRAISHPLHVQSPTADTLVVLFPGKDYGCDRPLLHYARFAALAQGCDVLSLTYGFQAAGVELAFSLLPHLITETNKAVSQALVRDYRQVVFISKSMGCGIAAQIAGDRPSESIRHVYLTPPESVVPLLENTQGLVVTSTADTQLPWHAASRLSAQPGLQLRWVDGANHSLEVPGDYRGSLRVLAQVTGWLADFLAGPG